MPYAPARPCTWPGCPKLTQTGRCDAHKRQERLYQDSRRGTSQQRGYTFRWHAARNAFLADHPLCSRCKAEGHVVAATVVDHIRPHKGNDALFWDERNWQALCKACHDSKTAREDGRWGRGKSITCEL